MEVTATLRGPLFTKKIDATVRAAIIDETLAKLSQRMTRNGPFGSGGKGLGVTRNSVGAAIAWPGGDTGVLTIESTANEPRTTGVKWTQKNMGIIRSMAVNVMRKTARRIASDLG